MDIEDRDAPIFDLSSLNALQDWTIGVNDFINLGNTDKIKNLTEQTINPIMRSTRGKDVAASSLKNLSNKLEDFTKIQSCCRGADLCDVNVENIKKVIQKVKEEENLIPPFKPLLDKIEEQLEPFVSDNISKGIECVEWLFRNGQYQQSITMLQETVISFFLEKDKRNITCKKEREIITSIIAVISREIPQKNWSSILIDNNITMDSNLYKIIDSKPEVIKNMDSLSGIRNDINHGGMKRDKGDSALNYKPLLKRYEELKNSLTVELKNA